MNPIPCRQYDQDIDNVADVFIQACARLGAILGLVHEGVMVGGLTGARLDELSTLLGDWQHDLPALQYWLAAEGYIVPELPFEPDGRNAMEHFMAWQQTLARISGHVRPHLVRAVEDYVRTVPGYVN